VFAGTTLSSLAASQLGREPAEREYRSAETSCEKWSRPWSEWPGQPAGEETAAAKGFAPSM